MIFDGVLRYFLVEFHYTAGTAIGALWQKIPEKKLTTHQRHHCIGRLLA